MASIWEKAISILAGNLNLGRSYLITAVHRVKKISCAIYCKVLRLRFTFSKVKIRSSRKWEFPLEIDKSYIHTYNTTVLHYSHWGQTNLKSYYVCRACLYHSVMSSNAVYLKKMHQETYSNVIVPPLLTKRSDPFFCSVSATHFFLK